MSPFQAVEDPDAYRADSRGRWEDAAGGWAAAREAFQRATAPVSHRLVEAIHPQPGHTVLELAAGPGDTGLLAAELLRPGGKLISTDGAMAMVEVAKARAEELGLSDVVETKPMEVEWIDLETASIDAVLCRWGYMLVPDPETAFRETRRVLKPGGRAAFAVWATAGENPWSMGRRLVDLGFAEPSPPNTPGPFALGDPDLVLELLYGAGWTDDITIEPLDFAFTAADADAWWAQQLDCSLALKALVAKLTPAEHYALRDAVDEDLAHWAQPDGTLRIPARTLVGAATA
jgi:SAM-dependent methyltransferase